MKNNYYCVAKKFWINWVVCSEWISIQKHSISPFFVTKIQTWGKIVLSRLLFLEKLYFKSQIRVHQYWTIQDHFCVPVFVSSWITPPCSKERKYHIFRQYWYTRNVPVFTKTGTFQYLAPEVYFFPFSISN